MPPRNVLWQISADILPCLGLGFLSACVRVLMPYRHKWLVFWADAACVVLLAMLLQSYAAGRSQAGELRWYMIAASALAYNAAEQIFLPQRTKFARKMQHVRHKSFRQAKKSKSGGQMRKKQLQNQPHLLYNSNI